MFIELFEVKKSKRNYGKVVFDSKHKFVIEHRIQLQKKRSH